MNFSALKSTIYTGKRYIQSLKLLKITCLVASIIPIIMTILNVVQHRGAMMVVATTMVTCLCWGSSIAAFFGNRRLSVILLSLVLTGLFTLFAVTGANDGFAILWTAIVPVVACYFISVRIGIGIGVYFELLFIVMFYTPLRNHFGSFYTDMFMNRYPLLFLCNLVCTSIAMVQYHISTFEAMNYEERLEDEVKRQTSKIMEQNKNLERMSEQMIETLAKTIDAKDKYTNGHSFRVSRFAELIGEELELPPSEVSMLRYEGLLHDIGKIGISDNILNKDGKLDDDEFSKIKQHTVTGYEILRKASAIPGAAEAAKHHHERWNGTGYPDHLKGEEIPLHSRILAIADAYDAMDSNRVYRNALTSDKIREQIEGGLGTQFDPNLGKMFLKMMDEGRLDAARFMYN